MPEHAAARAKPERHTPQLAREKPLEPSTEIAMAGSVEHYQLDLQGVKSTPSMEIREDFRFKQERFAERISSAEQGIAGRKMEIRRIADENSAAASIGGRAHQAATAETQPTIIQQLKNLSPMDDCVVLTPSGVKDPNPDDYPAIDRVAGGGYRLTKGAQVGVSYLDPVGKRREVTSAVVLPAGAKIVLESGETIELPSRLGWEAQRTDSVRWVGPRYNEIVSDLRASGSRTFIDLDVSNQRDIRSVFIYGALPREVEQIKRAFAAVAEANGGHFPTGVREICIAGPGELGRYLDQSDTPGEYLKNFEVDGGGVLLLDRDFLKRGRELVDLLDNNPPPTKKQIEEKDASAKESADQPISLRQNLSTQEQGARDFRTLLNENEDTISWLQEHKRLPPLRKVDEGCRHIGIAINRKEGLFFKAVDPDQNFAYRQVLALEVTRQAGFATPEVTAVYRDPGSKGLELIEMEYVPHLVGEQLPIKLRDDVNRLFIEPLKKELSARSDYWFKEFPGRTGGGGDIPHVDVNNGNWGILPPKEMLQAIGITHDEFSKRPKEEQVSALTEWLGPRRVQDVLNRKNILVFDPVE